MELCRIIKKIFHTVNPLEIKRKKHLLKEMTVFFDNLAEEDTMNKEKESWRKLFTQVIKTSSGKGINEIKRLFEGFAFEKLELIKKADTINNFDSPIVVCTQKNNLIYMKEFLPYYRELGVKHFVIIDNNSNDESLDFLMKQDDVTLFEAKYKFDGVKKAGWKLQTISYIGLGHWYLWLDSDEFIAYPNMEEIDLTKYIRILNDKKIQNVGGFMLDMYPSYNLMDEETNPEDFYNEYRFFDGDSPYYRFDNDTLVGGMRGRTLDIYNLRLDKTPLIYCSEANIPIGNHNTFPRRNNLRENYGCVLKHYKFISSDAKLYRERAETIDNGYSNFEAQKKYTQFIGNTVKDENSIEYINSSSLKVFTYLKDFTKGEISNE